MPVFETPHEITRKQRSCWYAYLYIQVLRREGYDFDEAKELALRKYPRARWHLVSDRMRIVELQPSEELR